jgi:hypothetical protein
MVAESEQIFLVYLRTDRENEVIQISPIPIIQEPFLFLHVHEDRSNAMQLQESVRPRCIYPPPRRTIIIRFHKCSSFNILMLDLQAPIVVYMNHGDPSVYWSVITFASTMD